jgi:phytoene synthase
MDPVAYCRDKAAPDGSANYYGVLFQPPSRRRALLALLALEQELREVVEACSEHAVAQHKLAFWQQEVGRMLAGAPAHPVARALAQHAPEALDANLLHALIDGVGNRLAHRQVRDEDEQEASCAATAGIVARLMACVLAPDDRAATNALQGAATAAERIRLLRFPRRAGLPPHSGVPLEMLTRWGVTPAAFDRGGDDERIAELRRELLQQARGRLGAARDALAATRGFAATRVRIAQAQATALERGGYVAHGAAREPLPLALLWCAWRARPRTASTA